MGRLLLEHISIENVLEISLMKYHTHTYVQVRTISIIHVIPYFEGSTKPIFSFFFWLWTQEYPGLMSGTKECYAGSQAVVAQRENGEEPLSRGKKLSDFGVLLCQGRPPLSNATR